jgi:N-acyl-D-amino-acid deacylase
MLAQHLSFPRLPSPFRRSPGIALVLAVLPLWGGCAADAAPRADSDAGESLPAGPWDLVIHNARLVDGTGAPAVAGGVLVRDGVIHHAGALDLRALEPSALEASTIVDAAGSVLAPGFIDAHAHGDPLETPGFTNFLAQGVTSILLGMDGTSPLPRDLAATMAATDALGPWVHVGWLVGHGSLRVASPTGYGPSTPASVAWMMTELERGFEAGALGLSLGLEYDGGRGADAEELARLGEVVARHDGIISSHLRSEDADTVEDALDELLEQGRRSGARVHASHLKIVLGNDVAQAEHLLARMAAARREGVRVSADVYPYTASFTGLSILFPDWARPPADYAEAVRTRREELRTHLQNRVESRNGPEAMLMATGTWRGMTLAEAAAQAGIPWVDLLVDLGPGGARAAYFVMNASVMRRFLMDADVVVSTDGSPTMLHPRGYGSFSWVLEHVVVREGLLSLEEAIRKMTGATAALVGLSNPTRVDTPRGLLRPGFAADLVLFDPQTVRAIATFEDPHQLSEGMTGVWVAGVRVVTDGLPDSDMVQGGGPGLSLRARTPHPAPLTLHKRGTDL